MKQLKSKIAILFILTFVAMLSFNACTSGLTYEINQSKCTGCKSCVSACSHGAISVSNGKATINDSKCVGCGKCAGRCSVGAITQS